MAGDYAVPVDKRGEVYDAKESKHRSMSCRHWSLWFMSIWRIAELVADRKMARALAQKVMELKRAGLLNQWENRFIRDVFGWLKHGRLSPRQASTLYHLWLERQRRTESDGVAVSSAIKDLKAIWSDLDDDEMSLLEELTDRTQEFVQLADLNRIARVAKSHGENFPRVRSGWCVQSDSDEKDVRDLARGLAQSKRRRSKRPQPRPEPKGNKGCGNDLGRLTRALDALEAALGKTSPQTG